MGSSKKVTVGYRYFFGIHMGVGKSIDELVEVNVGGKTAWHGSVTSNQTISIDAPNLFGGDEGEGGIAGTLDVMMGAPDQTVNSRLAAMLGGLVPAFRGVCTLFYDGLVTSLNPYPKPWKLRVRRALSGWDDGPWYPEKCVISLNGGEIKAMNPAHIIYQCLTDRDLGNMDPSRIDDASFRAAADQLYTEGFGLCLRWVRQDSLDTFVRYVLDHIAGNLFVSRYTGLFELTLTRDDYDPELLPLFDEESGLLSIEEDDSAATAGSINEVIIKWVSPIDGATHSKRERNLAAIQSSDQIIAQTIEYPGIPTSDLAGRVAVRELRARATGLKRFKVKLDRRGRKIKPGAPFRIRSLKRGISTIVVRVGRYDDGALDRGAISVTVVQDVFGMPATSLTPPQPPLWTPPDRAPAVASVRRLVEVSWRDLVRQIDPANLLLVDPTSAYVATLAMRPTSLSLGYAIESRVGSAAFAAVGKGDFSPTALLATAIGPAAGTVQLVDGNGLEQVAPGTAAMIGDELVRVDAINLATGILTFGRGCVDTVPAQQHAAGTRIWFTDDYLGENTTEYSTGVTVQVRLLPHTGSGSLAPELAPVDSLLFGGRQARPYPPGRLRINGAAWPTSVVGDVALEWAHRDRLTQADQLIDTSMASIGPEAGVTYSARLLRADTNAVLASQTAIAGTTATLAATYEGQVIVELWSVRSGTESHQRQRWTFMRTNP